MEEAGPAEALQKLSIKSSGWDAKESEFPLQGPLLMEYISPRSEQVSRVQAVLVVQASHSLPKADSGDKTRPVLPQETSGIKDASLFLYDNDAKPIRDALSLEQCVVCRAADSSGFEVQELLTKESLLFRAEENNMGALWFATLQFYAHNLGAWRQRRKGLADVLQGHDNASVELEAKANLPLTED